MGSRVRTGRNESATSLVQARLSLMPKGSDWASPRGFTLLELAVVMAIIVILAALAVPSLSGLTRMSSDSAARNAFRSLFASARVRAATTQAYVGIRFQQGADGRTYAVMLQPPSPSPAFPNACPAYQPNCAYLTLVAVGDTEPVMLPRGVECAIADLSDDPTLWTPDNTGCVPATTFTVVFSPAGQIVRKFVHVAQRGDQWYQAPGGGSWTRTWADPVFNLAGLGKFPPDVRDIGTQVASDAAANLTKDTDPDPQVDGPNTGRTAWDQAITRMSQGSIWVYERQNRLEAGDKPFTGYIQNSGALIPLNVYTGAPVNTRQ